ncbi:MAG TPA: helix-turn-helix transcriptional regulator, partial [bacterium]
MSKHLKHSYDDLEQFFSAPPTANQKAWGLLNQFYHLLLTYMENREIKKADLAKRLGRSRAAISQMFNKTPNISIRKMVEIADAVGLEFEIVPKEKQRDIAIHDEKKWGVPIPAP